MNKLPIFLLPSLLVLAACDGPAQTSPPAASAASAEHADKVEETAAPIAATTDRGILQADPATLPSCDPAVVNVRWDAGKAHPDLTAVEIHAMAPGETAGKLFAAGGAAGSAATGPWAKPGQVFLMLDTSGNELDRITLGGPACQ